jgi:Flp pilus assembly protein TadG
MATLKTARRSTERGQAVIELALTLPLLLIVVFGIIDFGFMFQRYEAVTNAAREGARLGALVPRPINVAVAGSYTKQNAEDRALAYLNASGLNGTAHTCVSGAVVGGTRCALMTTSSVPVTGSTLTVDQVTMIVEYDHEYQFVGPIMNLFGSGMGTIRLRATSIMRHE